MKEIWKDIEGYEGYYQISNLGRVKSLTKQVPFGYGMRTINEKILKPQKNEFGYLKVRLIKDTVRKHYKIHRLVAVAFIPNCEEKRCVNHIDGNKENNRVDNLEWVTHSENMKHAAANGLYKPWNKGKKYQRKTSKTKKAL